MMLRVGHGRYYKTKFSRMKTGLGCAHSLRLLEVGGISLKGIWQRCRCLVMSTSPTTVIKGGFVSLDLPLSLTGKSSGVLHLSTCIFLFLHVSKMQGVAFLV